MSQTLRVFRPSKVQNLVLYWPPSGVCDPYRPRPDPVCLQWPGPGLGPEPKFALFNATFPFFVTLWAFFTIFWVETQSLTRPGLEIKPLDLARTRPENLFNGSQTKSRSRSKNVNIISKFTSSKSFKRGRFHYIHDFFHIDCIPEYRDFSTAEIGSHRLMNIFLIFFSLVPKINRHGLMLCHVMPIRF